MSSAILLLLALAQDPSLEAEVKLQLSRVLPEKLAVVEVSIPTHIDEAEVSSIAASFRTTPKAGRSMVLLVLEKKDGARSKSWASVKIAEKIVVAVARRELCPGDRVTQDNVDLVERLNEGTSADRVLRRELARAIKIGTTIEADDVVLAPPLERGTPLTIIARSGAIEVATPGTLERPARTGEAALARSTRSNRVIRGRLIDQRTLLAEGNPR